ncbi:conserved hypothetical protein [Desulfamplus magnetovallimortis]|uniref:NERD domain-containing protein n=1 Tax=Desulfamplus magnetovallimortis TaxID=1246637 RepID=A0A1W1HHC2_9BACT|nr:conserved hypothetical protein [Desulfamplus magnetovallimortis]
MLYSFFSSLDVEIIPEYITNHGQVDMTIKLGTHIYVMEIKVVEQKSVGAMKCVDGVNDMNGVGSSAEGDIMKEMDLIHHNPALKQIKEKGYAEKYRGIKGVTVHEVGLVFSKKLPNLLTIHAETTT